MILKRLWGPVCLVTLATVAQAQPEIVPGNEPLPPPNVESNTAPVNPVDLKKVPLETFFMEYFDYRQRVYSSSENIGLGDRARLDAAAQYWFNQNTSARLRLEIDPDKYGEEDDQNATSRFELRLFHRYEQLEFQADIDVNGDEGGRGATSLGPDVDSKDSWIAYRPVETIRFLFRPYNLGTEIGQNFRTLDVARLNYISGTPAYISNLPVEDEEIRSKTVAGIELQWTPTPAWNLYVGAGTTSFQYPATDGFSIEQNASSERWESKEDRAYKAGIIYKTEQTSAVAEYATHLAQAETGALLDSAWSLQLTQWAGNFVGTAEWTMTRAGTEAYRLEDSGDWFEDTTPFRPVYSDYYGARQDWLGKTDSAELVRAGWKFGPWVPYIQYKHVGKYFIYRDRESAHRLRTADETAGSGGINIYGIGAFFTAGKFSLQPEVEFMQAKNEVFGSSSDIREDRVLSELKKKNTVFTLSTRYTY